MQLYENGAELQIIDHPRIQTLRVALNRLRRSPSPEPYKQPAAVAQGTTSPDQDSVETTPPDNPDPEPVETTLLVDTDQHPAQSVLPESADPEPHQGVEVYDLGTLTGDKELDSQETTSTPWTNRLRPRQNVARGRAI